MAKVKETKLDVFRPQLRNSNAHSQRGMGALESSMRKHGYVSPMTAAADGEIIDGSARLETVANVFDDNVLVLEHDGTRPIVMVRTDIASADTPEAREISIAANRIAELNLVYDAEVLLGDLSSGVDMTGLFDTKELDAMFAQMAAKTTKVNSEIDHDEMWQGMPEFEQEDAGAIHSIKVNFATLQDIAAFADLVEQTVTDKSRYIWYPYKADENLKLYRAKDES